MAKKTIILSAFLILVVLTASYYILVPNKIRIDVLDTKTYYSVFEGDEFVLAGTEYINLFDGPAKMRAKHRERSFSIENNITTFKRVANYKDNITVIDYTTYDSSVNDIRLVPVLHETICYNCEGKILQFEYRDILYQGETKEISSPFSFGHNMKLEWQDGAYFQKVYQNKVASDKIWIRYRPKDSIENYLVRLFDPPPSEYNVSANFPTEGYYTDTDLQPLIEFNCTTNFNSSVTRFYLSNKTNGSLTLNKTYYSNINQTVNALVNITVPAGDYFWTCNSDNSTGTTFWADKNITFSVNATGVNYSFGANILYLAYPVNYSVINWSTIITPAVLVSGNYQWNFTQTNVQAYNLTDYLFEIKNNGYYDVNVFLNKSEDKPWYTWTCGSNNITTTPIGIANLTAGSSSYLNCSLSLYNASQTYVNWTKTVDNATFNFTFQFSANKA